MKRIPIWLLVAITGILLYCFCFYPGFHGEGITWQLRQARTGMINDWNPPFLSYLWSFLDRIIPGMGGLFLLHASLFWIGISLFADYCFRDNPGKFIVPLLVGLYLPLLCVFGDVMKDSGVAGAWCFACGLLLNAKKRNSFLSLMLGLLGLLYGMAIRHNGFIVAFPLFFWAASILRNGWMHFHPWLRRLHIGLLGTIFFIGSVGGINLFERVVIQPEMRHTSQEIMVYDLAAVSIDQQTIFLPPFYNLEASSSTIKTLKRIFNPVDAGYLIWRPFPLQSLGYVRNDQELHTLARYWLAMILSKPRAYIRERFRLFGYLLGIDLHPNWPYGEVQYEIVSGRSFRSYLKRKMLTFMRSPHNDPLFKGWFYLFLIGLAILWERMIGAKDSSAFWWIALSALLYEAAYFFLAPGALFRYSFWSLCVALLLPMLLSRKSFEAFK